MENKIVIADKRQYQPIALKDKHNRILVYHLLEDLSFNKKEVSIPKSNIVSLFINKANIEFETAKRLFYIIISTLKKDSEIQSLVYDYLESSMSCIINIFNAVEAFTNLTIPNDYIYKKQNKGSIIELRKKEIERWCSIDEKINKVIPNIYKIESPNKAKFWSNLKLLQNLRDDIIHPKTYSEKIDPDGTLHFVDTDVEFYKKFLNENFFEIFSSGTLLIEYIIDKTPPNESYPIMKILLK